MAGQLGRQGGGWRSQICMKINQEEQLGSKTDHITWASSTGKESLETLAVKTYGDCGIERNSQTHRRVCWKDPQGLKMYTNPSTQESAPEGPNLLVGSGAWGWGSD